MKRYLALCVLCLVLAAAVLAGGALCLSRQGEAIRPEVTASVGDAAAARGITVGSELLHNRRLLWSTLRRPAADTDETRFSYHTKEVVPRREMFWDASAAQPQLALRFCNRYDENDPLTRAAREKTGGEGTVEIPTGDYFATYPLWLGMSYSYSYSVGSGLYNLPSLTAEKDWKDENRQGAAFPLLQVPVEAQDTLSVYYYRSGKNPDNAYMTADPLRMAHRFGCLPLREENALYLAVCFAADADPQADWAPKGFGIWRIPLEKTDYPQEGLVRERPRVDAAALVFPLDIEKQAVLAFARSADESQFLLVTAEEGQAVLRVLDGTTCQELACIPLGSLQTVEGSVTYYLNDGEYTVDYVDYPAVYVHSERDFLALAVGEELTVLTPEDGAYTIDFQCRMAQLRQNREDGRFYWMLGDESPKEKGGTYFRVFSPLAASYPSDFTTLPMCYRDHKLAIAWYDDSTAVNLHVYGAGGLLYGEQTVLPIDRQLDPAVPGDLCNVALVPSLAWEP